MSTAAAPSQKGKHLTTKEIRRIANEIWISLSVFYGLGEKLGWKRIKPGEEGFEDTLADLNASWAIKDDNFENLKTVQETYTHAANNAETFRKFMDRFRAGPSALQELEMEKNGGADAQNTTAKGKTKQATGRHDSRSLFSRPPRIVACCFARR